MTRSDAAQDLLGLWPLFGIRLTTPDLELRPAPEADLRLARGAWLRSGRGSAVRVVGVESALPLFGLGDEHD